MSRLEALKSAKTLGEVATLLQFKPAALSYLIIKQPVATRYTTFEIPKRNGGTRTINAPCEPLKLCQSKLSILLQDCLDEINKAKNRRDTIAHGFKRQRSIITNATWHRRRRYLTATQQVGNNIIEGYERALAGTRAMQRCSEAKHRLSHATRTFCVT
jgi:RNA-directed DNA polymerase